MNRNRIQLSVGEAPAAARLGRLGVTSIVTGGSSVGSHQVVKKRGSRILVMVRVKNAGAQTGFVRAVLSIFGASPGTVIGPRVGLASGIATGVLVTRVLDVPPGRYAAVFIINENDSSGEIVKQLWSHTFSITVQ